MKNRSLIAGALIVLLLLFTFICDNEPALASDQKLAHGAGTLPHLTSAVTVSMGAEIPTPIIYAFRYDIGLGNRVQLGLATSVYWVLGLMIGVEVHSMFNVLKTSSDSDFLSLYLNPGIFIIDDFLPELFGPNNITLFLVRPGVAYEHRFGDKRSLGLYVKVGAIVLLGGTAMGEFFGLELSPETIIIDCRAGLQALLGKRFSIDLEPMVLSGPSLDQPSPGGKAALTWAF
jgi:hypothetical protein